MMDVRFFLRLLTLIAVAASLGLLGYSVQFLLHSLHIPLDITSGKGPGQVLFYLIMLVGLFVFVRYIWNPRSIATAWQAYKAPMNRSRLIRSALITAGITLIASISGYLLLFVIGGAFFDPAALPRINLGKIGEVIVAALVAPILVTTEEVIFRGMLYNYLRGASRGVATKISAMLVSAFLFAFAHGYRDLGAWLHTDKEMLFTGLFLLGILTALVYEISASLLPGIGIHAALIWTEVVRARTNIVRLDQSRWWMGMDGDPRTGPYIWLLFALLIALALVFRRQLYAIAAVEPAKIVEPVQISAR